MGKRLAKAEVAVVRQRTSYTCVAASLSSALACLEPDADIGLVDHLLSNEGGSYFEEAMEVAQIYGVASRYQMLASVEDLAAWTALGLPVIIGWNTKPKGAPRNRHASVVFDVTDRGVLIMDPHHDETLEVPFEEFDWRWQEDSGSNGWRYTVRRSAIFLGTEPF